jgi:hypothetical protein
MIQVSRWNLAKAQISDAPVKPAKVSPGFFIGPCFGRMILLCLFISGRQYEKTQYFHGVEMAKKKASRGGARPGAGRKVSPEGKAVTVVATVPESLVEGLDAVAEAQGWNRSKAVTEAIRGLLKRKTR